jgi:hypothetical protein
MKYTPTPEQAAIDIREWRAERARWKVAAAKMHRQWARWGREFVRHEDKKRRISDRIWTRCFEAGQAARSEGKLDSSNSPPYKNRDKTAAWRLGWFTRDSDIRRGTVIEISNRCSFTRAPTQRENDSLADA